MLHLIGFWINFFGICIWFDWEYDRYDNTVGVTGFRRSKSTAKTSSGRRCCYPDRPVEQRICTNKLTIYNPEAVCFFTYSTVHVTNRTDYVILLCGQPQIYGYVLSWFWSCVFLFELHCNFYKLKLRNWHDLSIYHLGVLYLTHGCFGICGLPKFKLRWSPDHTVFKFSTLTTCLLIWIFHVYGFGWCLTGRVLYEPIFSVWWFMWEALTCNDNDNSWLTTWSTAERITPSGSE